MNIALIFAGGTGQRMNSRTKPKQFLELHGKSIILYTLEQFEQHPEINGILVVCLRDWIGELREQLEPETAMLIKASHAMHFEQLVEQLRGDYD